MVSSTALPVWVRCCLPTYPAVVRLRLPIHSFGMSPALAVDAGFGDAVMVVAIRRAHRRAAVTERHVYVQLRLLAYYVYAHACSCSRCMGVIGGWA